MNEEERLYEWEVTNLRDAKSLVQKLHRDGLGARQCGSTVFVISVHRPWARLSGHMTSCTQIQPRKL